MLSRVLQAAGAAFLGQIIHAITQIAHVRLFSQYWSVGDYADWIKLSTIPGFFAIATGGFGAVVVNALTIELGQQKKSTRQRPLFLGACYLIGLITMVLVILAGTVPLAWVADFFRLRSLGAHELRLLLVAFCLQFGAQQLRSFLSGCFRSLRMIVKGIYWDNAIRLGILGVSVTTIAAGGSPIHVALSIFGTLILGLGLMAWSLRSIEPNFRISLSPPQFSLLAPLLLPSVLFNAIPLGHALRQQGVIIVLGRVLDDSAVVSFNAMRTMSNAISQLVGLTSRSIIPEFSIAFGEENMSRMRSIHRHACRVALAGASAFAVIFAILGPYIFILWTSGRIDFDYATFCILLLVLIARSVWMTSSSVAMATNRHARIAVGYLMISGTVLLPADAIVSAWSVAGAALVLLVVDTVMVGVVLPQSLHFTSDRLVPFLAALVGRNTPNQGAR